MDRMPKGYGFYLLQEESWSEGYTVAQLAGLLVALRTGRILGFRVDSDQNVLYILTPAKALDRKDLGFISNEIAEDYKGHGFPCLSSNQKVSSFCIT